MEEYQGENDIREIFDLAKKGDQKAFGTLYELYYSPIFRYVAFRIKDSGDIDDIVQVIFMKVLKSLPRMTLTHETPLPFFYTVARNTIIDHWRKKKTVHIENSEALFGEIPDIKDSPLESVEKKESAKSIRESIQELSPDQQEVLTLRFINELSNKEISKVMDKTEVAIRQLQSRALRVLRSRMKSA
jgi:RNA polymerase sigma-70 factor, ECF subfamily